MSAQLALALPCAAPSNCVVINARCSLHIEEDQRVIVVAGLPVHHYRAEDAVAEAYAMVFLVEAGFAQQREVAHAFGRSERTVRRYQERYAQGGMAALRRAEGWRRGRRRIRGKRLRQITRLCDNGHQTQIITSRLDLRDIEIAWRMFERWRQENFFKYMREEFLLDALVDYRIEAEDPTRTIPNPERRVLDKQIRSACSELSAIERAYGAAVANNIEQKRRTMRGFKIAHGKLGKKLRAARARLTKLIAQRRAVAARVEIRDLSEGAVVKLATERKHLTDIIKMVAYQTESDLLALLRPHYARAEQEGRTLLHEIFAAAGDIRVSDTELHITLAPLSSPHRTHAAQALCEVLDQTATVFPGSRLRHPLHRAPTTTHRPRLPRLPARAPRSFRPHLGQLIDAETGHIRITLCQEF